MLALVLVTAAAGCGDDSEPAATAPAPDSSAPDTAPVTSAPETSAPDTAAPTTTADSTVEETTTTAAAFEDVVTPLDPGPLSPRREVAAAASTDRVVVYGGTAAGIGLDDGAAYDPVSETWSALASSNGLAAGASAALAVGDSIVFAGPAGVATLDLAAGSWTALDAAPYPDGRFVVSSATMLVLEGDPARGVDGTVGAQGVAVLDPADGTWTALPPVPVAEVTDAVVADGEVTVVALASFDAPGRVAMRFDGSGWTDLGMPVVDWFFGSFAFTDGTDLVVWANASAVAPNANDHGVAYSVADGAWRDVPQLPGDAWECYASAVAAGTKLYVDNCASTAVVDLASGEMVLRDDLVAAAQSTETLVFLDGAVYRWGAEYCYAECADPPETVRFHRLAAGL